MTKNRTISAVIFLERSEEITKWPFPVASAPASSSHCRSRRHRCYRFVIVTTRQHLRRNPFRRKKRQKKSIFIYGTTFKKNESGSDFQRIQIWNTIAHKNKKRITAGTHCRVSFHQNPVIKQIDKPGK
jgi:hypothetical protein